MGINEKEFAVLRALVKKPKLTQRQLAETTSLSLGSVNAACKHLACINYINNGSVTADGIDALKPYAVDNAIIMAAGLSSRFVPLSYERPKGLLTVRGEVLIERQIRQLQAVGIANITVVVGYMKELFFYLEDKFNVNIQVNEAYSKRNNNSTLMLVREQLGNTYICSSDDYFTENVFHAYEYQGYYSVSYFEGETDEYCITEGVGGTITRVDIGGNDAWAMLGHVYFDSTFSRKFRKILESEYELPATKGKLWEDIYIDHIHELKLVAKHFEPGIIYEFDSLRELTTFDQDFLDNVDSEILDNICVALQCQRQDICNIAPIKEGLTNLSFQFTLGAETYVYRHPGNGTDKIIVRESEAFSQSIAKELGIDGTFVYEDMDKGWKISRYIPDSKPLDYHNRNQVVKALSMIRRLHQSGKVSHWTFDLFDKAESIIRLLNELSYPLAPEFDKMHDVAIKLSQYTGKDNVERCLCHNDFYSPNFLVSGNEIYLIDWEYSAMSDYASDLGTFICCSDYSIQEATQTIEEYFQGTPTPEEYRHCIAYVSLAAWYWYVWALYKEASGDPVGEWLYLWYRYAKSYGTLAIELYEESITN